MLEAQESSPVVAADDTYAWLEDVTGEKALDWVRARNKLAQEKLEADAGFAGLNADLLAILDSDSRIPMVSKQGDYYYNFWRDKNNPRGLWRRTTLAEYEKAEPRWDVILDLDALGAKENVNWVWGGARLLRPDYTRALIGLSRGGADARVHREFDLNTREFVADGFTLEEAKGSVGWIDLNTVFVQTDFGTGSMTDSGYPRIAKTWKRGQALSDAETVYEGQQTDMLVAAVHDDSPGFERDFVSRNIAFYNDELYLLRDKQLIKIDAPNSANKGVFHDLLTIELREPWEVGGTTYPAGALLIGDFDKYLAGEGSLDLVFEPTDNTALAGFGFTKDYLYLNVLEDVKNRIYVCRLGDPQWTRQPLVGAPAFGTVSIGAVDADESNDFFMTATDYLTPTTLSLGEIGKEPRRLKSLPEFFDASNLEISQNFAVSKDGTKVPYFMVSNKGMTRDGNNPTLLYGYGGFEISMQPSYSAGVGRAWTTRGGVYVVANIRGGGEYGPRWHQAALKANRLRAFEDFAAVAEDLFARKITSPRRLGIQGGSNGGLLVGNMLTLYPDLMRAVVCQVPLLDMKRYNKLLAGASWMAEYGNPDKPEEWEFIRTFSPYHNVRNDRNYPAVLFVTSTRDDRVHPGHARKMMAKMEEFGQDVVYYENIEGGHGGAADNKQAAFMQTLGYIFLKQKLFGP
ncbi:MAG: S9 family peptidase [Planctomycetes bacterium]|nr:S9 family peptidase [Planctomycetota bacterium]